MYREIAKCNLVTKNLDGTSSEAEVAKIVYDIIAANDEKWSLLFFTSQYLETPPDSPFFSELTSKLTTSGFGNCKTLQEFLDQPMNLAQSMILSYGLDPEGNERPVHHTKWRFQLIQRLCTPRWSQSNSRQWIFNVYRRKRKYHYLYRRIYC